MTDIEDRVAALKARMERLDPPQYDFRESWIRFLGFTTSEVRLSEASCHRLAQLLSQTSAPAIDQAMIERAGAAQWLAKAAECRNLVRSGKMPFAPGVWLAHDAIALARANREATA
jgi:hypothetical protein